MKGKLQLAYFDIVLKLLIGIIIFVKEVSQMILKLVEDKLTELTKITIEYKEIDEQVQSLVNFIEHLDEIESNIIASCDGKIYSLKADEVLYIESVDRKTFAYTMDEVYEMNLKLYEVEEKYCMLDYMRVSKASIVNLKRIKSLMPDFGGRILATMDNDEKIYISRQYAPLLKKKIGIGGR